MKADVLAYRLRPDWVDPAGVSGGTPLHKIARRILPLPARWALARLRWDAVDGVKDAAETAQKIGWPAVTQLRWAELAGKFSSARRLRTVRIPGYPHALYYREGSSDPQVIEQVFGRQEYACVANENDVQFIIDCGANVGYTAAYLLNRYPSAQIAVIEPDTGNLAVCKKNLASFEDRVTYFHAGIWGESGPMAMDRTGEEWAFQARPALPGETVEFNAMTIGEVAHTMQFPRIDLLKVDIEGAEENVFTHDSADWLPLTKTLVIELHGEDCERAVVNALAGTAYDRSTSGELTVFRGIHSSTARLV